MRCRRSLVLLVVAALLAGCGGGDGGDGGDAPTGLALGSGPVDETTSGDAASDEATSELDCGEPTPIPAGAQSREVEDLDGDGAPDTIWLGTPDEHRYEYGVTYSGGEGARYELQVGPSSSGSLVVVDAGGPEPLVLFDRSDGTYLHVHEPCTLSPIVGADGMPLVLDRDGDPYTGIGCADLPEGRRLVALSVDDTGGEQVGWSQAVVVLDGREARLRAPTDATYQRPADEAAIARLGEVTCGDVTVATHGLTVPAP